MVFILCFRTKVVEPKVDEQVDDENKNNDANEEEAVEKKEDEKVRYIGVFTISTCTMHQS